MCIVLGASELKLMDVHIFLCSIFTILFPFTFSATLECSPTPMVGHISYSSLSVSWTGGEEREKRTALWKIFKFEY